MGVDTDLLLGIRTALNTWAVLRVLEESQEARDNLVGFFETLCRLHRKGGKR